MQTSRQSTSGLLRHTRLSLAERLRTRSATSTLSGPIYWRGLMWSRAHIGHQETMSDYRSWILVVVYGACSVVAFVSLNSGRTSFLTVGLTGLVAVIAAIGAVSACIRLLSGASFRSAANELFTGLFCLRLFRRCGWNNREDTSPKRETGRLTRLDFRMVDERLERLRVLPLVCCARLWPLPFVSKERFDLVNFSHRTTVMLSNSFFVRCLQNAICTVLAVEELELSDPILVYHFVYHQLPEPLLGFPA